MEPAHSDGNHRSVPAPGLACQLQWSPPIRTGITLDPRLDMIAAELLQWSPPIRTGITHQSTG